MDPLKVLHLQMRLEGKALVDERFMRQVEVVPGEERSLMLVAQLANGELVTYYEQGISLGLYKELTARQIEFPDIGSLLELLRSHHISFEVGHYRTYIFPSLPLKDMQVTRLSKHEPRVKAFGFDGFAEDVYGIEHGDKIVSACVSARENRDCGEAWVYTEAAYRHQGFAQKVVNAWAASLMEAGKVPFYSHKIENRASAGLAGKLGLQFVFEEIAITQRDTP
jgi:RimJ/RimL family protein N-acetyltransferase